MARLRRVQSPSPTVVRLGEMRTSFSPKEHIEWEMLHGDAPKEKNNARKHSHHQRRQAGQTIGLEPSHPLCLLC
jgi:hypothetical protein